jgi:DNA modification methylase
VITKILQTEKNTSRENYVMKNKPKIEILKTDSLIPYARNSRTHSEAQVAQIAGSIREFGFTNPVLIDAENGIIAGHGRIMAAQKLGLAEVPCIRLDHLTETQRKAYVIADNKLALNSGWDETMLALELAELQDDNFDLSLTGFDESELADLLAETIEGETDPDEVPEPPVNPVTVLGDVWVMGKHRLLCGDSTNIDAVEKLMAGKKADICFTSPPYNAGSMNIGGNETTGKKYNSFDDNKTETDYFDFIVANLNCIFTFANEVLYNIGIVENNKRVIIDVMSHYRDRFKDIIYWKKSTVAPHIQPGVINNLVEFILCFGDGKRKFENAQFSQGSYWNVIEGSNASGNEFAKIHKATFPIYLPENIITNFCPPRGTVLDTFGGTGTTLIACEKTDRDARLMELDPKYCDVIIKRWQDFAGKKAIHEASGKTFDEMKEQQE